MTVTLVVPDHVRTSLVEQAALPYESAGILIARYHCAQNGDMRLFARALHWLPSSSYAVRTATTMSITAPSYVQPLHHAAEDHAIPLWIHTHPNGNPSPSEHDRLVDAQIADLFRIRSGSRFYGTVIISPRSNDLAFTGTLQEEGRATKSIDRVWFPGDRWRFLSPHGQSHTTPKTLFDRNIRAFGPAIQETISSLRIAIVGAGGTGSAVAEQLVRLGARDLLLVDGKTLRTSNVTRVYGSTQAQVGQPKVEVLRDHLQRIFPATHCETVRGLCSTQGVARTLANVDLAFGCTDDNAGRLVLSRLSTYYMVPVIDTGVLLSSDPHGNLIGIDARVTVLSPGTACLVCRGRLDLRRAAAEQQDPTERERLVDEGYAPALGQVEPAVVPFTTMVAAAAVSELLERLIGYGYGARPSEVLLRVHDREISTNVAKPKLGHYCHPGQRKQGTGDTEPFMEQIWGA